MKRQPDPHEEITLLIDDELLHAMLEESELLGDPDVETTIARRLTQGVSMAEIVGPRELLWRPVHHDSIDIAIQLPASTVRRLKDVAGAFGYGVPVLLCTILYNDACKPWEVRELEKRTPFGPLRWEPGRGNIYSVRVDLPGYQIVFLRMLARNLARRDAIVSEALLALARQIQTAGALGGFPVPGDALEFAQKMVRSADLNAAR